MLILSERTPNPEALKFLPHMRLTDGRGFSFTRESADLAASPLALALFELDGVDRVHIGEDFVTVTRRAGGEAWTTLRIQVVAAIADILGEGRPAVVASDGEGVSSNQLEEEIRQVLGLHVRPGVARDGGDIVFDHLDVETGILWIRMEGACGGCPSSRLTLKDAVERIVRRYVPEVKAVEEVIPDKAERQPPPWPRWLKAAQPTTGAPKRPVFRHNGRVVRD